MTDSNKAQADNAHSRTERGRRRFLLLVPAGIGLGILTTLVSAAVRFLRPQSASAPDNDAREQWLPVAPATELTGAQPLARTISVQHETGWTQVLEQHPVIVLPQAQRVLSALCPHEGCTVFWRAEDAAFLCPCHDSRFNVTGACMSGPAARDLDQLPARLEDGVLKVRWPASGPTTT